MITTYRNMIFSHKPNPFSSLLMFVVLLAVGIPPADAQSSNGDLHFGSIRGRVVDAETGDALPGVQVFIESLARGDVTDADGVFEIDKVPVGRYRLQMRLIGYAPVDSAMILIRAGDVLRFDARLQPRVFEAHEIQVTANRHETLVENVPLHVTTLSRRKIRELNAGQTPELLREQPGVLIQKTNQGGGSPVIRGLKANKVLLLVDGIRMNNATYRGGNLQYLNTVSPSVLERIEVVRGPVSALYGSDAFGGTINILTRRPGTHNGEGLRWSGRAAARISTADATKTGSFSLQTAARGWGVFADFSWRRYGDLRRGTRGGDELMRRLHNDSRISRSLPELQSPNGYSAWSAYGHALLKPSQQSTLSLVWQIDRQNDVPRYDVFETGKYEVWKYAPQERDLVYLRFEHSGTTAFYDAMTATLSLHRQFERRIKRRVNRSSETSDEFGTLTPGIQLQLNKIWRGKHFLTYGAELWLDRVSAASTRRDLETGSLSDRAPLFPDGSSYNSFGLYAQGEFVLTPRWSLTLGSRYNSFDLRAPFPQEHSRFGTVTLSPSALTGSLSSLFSVNENFKLVGSVAQGFRAPNLNDAVKLGPGKGDSFYDVPNPDLEPESILSIEGGFKFVHERARLTAIGFYSRLSDLLLRAPAQYRGLPYLVEGGDTLAVFHTTNLGRGSIAGFELGGEYNPGDGVVLFGNLSFARGENLLTNEPLPAIPPLSGVVGLRWRTTRMRSELSSRFSAAQTRLAPEDKLDLRIPEGGTPGWFTLNFRTEVLLSDNTVLRLAMLNILDQNYREYLSGFNAPGRNYVLSGEVRL